MQWVSIFALGFIVWWTVLFAVLPFGLRTQDEEGAIIAGTTESAPVRPRFLRIISVTTLVTAAILGVFFGLTWGLGYSFDDIPSFIPEVSVRS